MYVCVCVCVCVCVWVCGCVCGCGCDCGHVGIMTVIMMLSVLLHICRNSGEEIFNTKATSSYMGCELLLPW